MPKTAAMHAKAKPAKIVESDSEDEPPKKPAKAKPAKDVESDSRELFEAARHGEIATVMKLLKAGVDVHSKGKLDGCGRSVASRVQPVGLG
jgi:hypothetical protein